MNYIDLDKQPEEIIKEIKKAFPLNLAPKKLVNDRREYHGKVLLENLDGKNWRDVINNPYLVIYMSDIDYVWALTEKAYIYYLPALLISTVISPANLLYTNTLVYIGRTSSKLNFAKLQTLIAYFTYQEQFWQRDTVHPHRTVKETIEIVENQLLGLLFLLDAKKPKP